MPVIYIYLRHGPKEYKNGRATRGRPQHDPPITRSSISFCQEVGTFLIKNYGIPKIVIVSPYLRTRQTGKLLTNSLPYYIKNRFYTDNNIAEYLGNLEGNIDVTNETLDYATDPVSNQLLLKMGETKHEFNFRIKEHLSMLQITTSDEEDVFDSKTTVVWVVTHGYTISTIYNILKEKGFTGCDIDSYYPEEMEGLIIKMDGKESTISLLKTSPPIEEDTTQNIL